ncbi:hypothetical protein HK096_004547, partial [Nowakowskiella sp. JEL0078]
LLLILLTIVAVIVTIVVAILTVKKNDVIVESTSFSPTQTISPSVISRVSHTSTDKTSTLPIETILSPAASKPSLTSASQIFTSDTSISKIATTLSSDILTSNSQFVSQTQTGSVSIFSPTKNNPTVTSTISNPSMSCPSSNGTIYTSILQPGHFYIIHCNKDVSGTSGAIGIELNTSSGKNNATSFKECVESCAAVLECTAVAYNFALGNCYAISNSVILLDTAPTFDGLASALLV